MADMKFEEGIKRLEKIVQDLETGNIPLEDALDKYEEGIKLSKMCAKKLEVAKKKVELLLKSEDGTFELKPFDEGSSGEPMSSSETKRKKKRAEGEELS